MIYLKAIVDILYSLIMSILPFFHFQAGYSSEYCPDGVLKMRNGTPTIVFLPNGPAKYHVSMLYCCT